MGAWLACTLCLQAAWAGTVQYVIQVSVDGLRPDAITTLGPSNVPNFYRLRDEGAFTDNARADYDNTETLPNHCTVLTARGVIGVGGNGHMWTSNSDPAPGQTLHTNKGSYVAGVFDVVHDNGLRTGLYASKTKFSLFDVSWNATNGAPDTIGEDNGRDKLDVYLYNYTNNSTATLTSSMISAMNANPFNYVLLHLTEPDTVGHSSGWMSTAYLNAVKTMDQRLGALFNLIENNPTLNGRTALIVSSDHGGTGTGHGDATNRLNYTIPFYVWGPGVLAGADLYDLNEETRLDPGTGRPNYAAAIQPIRHGDGVNLALQLLGLGPIPGSSINASQNLIVPEPTSLVLVGFGMMGVMMRLRRKG